MTDGKHLAATDNDPATLMPAEPIALLDMDGTLCDCSGAIAKALVQLRGPNEDPSDEDAPELPPHIAARRRLIMSVPGFWRNLQPLPLGFQVLNVLEELEFHPHVLTKGPACQPLGWTEKFDWCRQHVPHLPIIMTEDKGLVYGRVLVDDWPHYIARWLQWRPQGLVIVPAQPWNQGIEARFPTNSVRYDGTNLDVLRLRLLAIRDAVQEHT